MVSVGEPGQVEDADMKAESKRVLVRREFLRALGAGAAATAVAPLAAEAKGDNESGDKRRKSGYKKTDHIKAFYSVNRYPS